MKRGTKISLLSLFTMFALFLVMNAYTGEKEVSSEIVTFDGDMDAQLAKCATRYEECVKTPNAANCADLRNICDMTARGSRSSNFSSYYKKGWPLPFVVINRYSTSFGAYGDSREIQPIGLLADLALFFACSFVFWELVFRAGDAIRARRVKTS